MTSLERMLRRRSARNRRPGGTRPTLCELEVRALPAVLHPMSYVLGRFDSPSSSPVPGYTPQQIRHAYGLDGLSFDASHPANGYGQTIAIITAFDDPNLADDLAAFDAYFNIAAPPALTIVAQDGSHNLPSADDGWAQETALDVEWAHAMAPGARLRVVEANSADETDLYASVATAAADPTVNVVSMSFGGPESIFETTADGYFLPPNVSHPVTFFAAAGDDGAVTYPAASPNVIGVGGTTLVLDGQNNRASETAWSNTGGGLSKFEPTPAFQAGLGLSRRGTPDLAYNADPTTGFAVYDSYGSASNPWLSLGGTSAGAPQWAAILAVVDQGRGIWGNGPLRGPAQTLPLLYGSPSSFFDVTSGGNGHYQAGPGYDLVSGLGAPNPSQLIDYLVHAPAPGTTPSQPTAPSVPPSAPTTGTSPGGVGTNLGPSTPPTLAPPTANQDGPTQPSAPSSPLPSGPPSTTLLPVGWVTAASDGGTTPTPDGTGPTGGSLGAPAGSPTVPTPAATTDQPAGSPAAAPVPAAGVTPTDEVAYSDSVVNGLVNPLGFGGHHHPVVHHHPGHGHHAATRAHHGRPHAAN